MEQNQLLHSIDLLKCLGVYLFFRLSFSQVGFNNLHKLLVYLDLRDVLLWNPPLVYSLNQFERGYLDLILMLL